MCYQFEIDSKRRQNSNHNDGTWQQRVLVKDMSISMEIGKNVVTVVPKSRKNSSYFSTQNSIGIFSIVLLATPSSVYVSYKIPRQMAGSRWRSSLASVAFEAKLQ